MLTPRELRLLHPRKRLKAFSPSSPLEILRAEQEEDEGEASQSYGPGSNSSKKPKEVSATYLWSGLVRVDVMSGPASCLLVFYGPKTMRVYGLPLLQEGQEVEIDLAEDSQADGGDSGSGSDADDEQPSTTSSSSSTEHGGSSSRTGVLFCTESVAARGGLVPHSLVVKSPIPTSSCLADIAVSGLPGWIGVYAPFTKQDIVLRVWVPRGVEVFLRPALPCPPPPKPVGSEEPEELLDIGQVLGQAEQDQEWEAHREGLGLDRKLSVQDEDILKMLMFGDESAGLQGIVDLDEEEEEQEWEQEEEQQQQLRAEQLVGRVPAQRAGYLQRGSSSSSRLSRVQHGRGTADDHDTVDAGAAAGGGSSDGEGWIVVPTSPKELGLPAVQGEDIGERSARQRRMRRGPAAD